MASQMPPIPAGMDLSDDQSPHIIVSIAVCMALSGLAVIARLVSRRLKKTRLQASDYAIIVGLIGAWIVSLLITQEARVGLGKHWPLVPLANVRDILLWTYVGEIFYSISFTVIKISILLMYRQIFPNRRMILGTYFIGAFVLMWGISLVLVTIFSCVPIHAFWDVDYLGPKQCVDSKWFFIGNAIPNILADIMILVLPLQDLWGLQMSTKQKVTVCGMFLLGGFVIVASGLRIHFMVEMDMSDLTYSYTGVGLWTAVEIDIAVLSACLPTLRPLLGLIMPSMLTQKDVSSRNTGSNIHGASGKWPNSKISSRGKFESQNEEFQRLPEYPLDDVRSSTTS